MPAKANNKLRSNADFKSAAIALLENDNDWSKVPASVKGPFSAQSFIDNPQFIVNDETHFIGAYMTKKAFDAYRKEFKVKISESKHEYFIVESWKMELVKVDSEEVFTSYADREVRLVIEKLKHDPKSNLTANTFVENLHRDNDLKLQVARMNLEEVREATEMPDLGDLSRVEGKRVGVDKKATQEVELEASEETKVLSLKEILKKETPTASLAVYEPTDESSSFFKKRDTKDLRKSKLMRNPSEIKKAVENIIKYRQKPSTKKSGKTSNASLGKRSRKSSQKKSTTKKGMTITAFKEYIGWYDQQAKAGKLSIAQKKASASSKRSVASKSSRRK